TKVAALTEGVLKTMFVTRAKTATALLLAVGIAAGASLLTHQVIAGKNADAAKPAASKAPATDNAKADTAKGPATPRSDAAKREPSDQITVRGRVLDRDGKPFAMAKLYLGGHAAMKEAAYPVRATSGGDGMFKFTFGKSELDKANPDNSTYQ